MKHILLLAATASVLSFTACKGAPDEASQAAAEQAMDSIDTARAAVPELALQDKSAIEAARWMEANGKRPDVITLPSGLQYTIVKSGDKSGVSPKPGQTIKAHYEGKFIDGNIFDSSYAKGAPIVYPSNGFINGWNEALGMMKPGDVWTLYVPPNLAYGPRGRSSIPPNSVLIFKMELIENM
jgi:FKBP-type peptidyl-prolyl cis-trans isomerase